MSFFTRYSRMKKRVGMLETSVQELNASFEATVSAQRAAFSAQQAVIENQQATISAQQLMLETQGATIEALQGKVATMEAKFTAAFAAKYTSDGVVKAKQELLTQILTGGSAARPPGAVEAVPKLPSPCVSVVLPTFNRAHFLPDAITSVQRQSFANWELIIVDDGSTDDTATVVAPFLADRRIKYVVQANAGGAAARNRVIQESGAPFIAYLDSDNVWYPDFLACAVDFLATASDVDMVYGALVSDQHGVGKGGILWKPFDRDALLTANFLDTNVIVHRRTLVERHGPWDVGMKRLTDWDLTLRFTSEKPAHPLPVLAAFYRTCDDQRVSAIQPLGPNHVRLMRKWFPPANLVRRPRVLYAVWHYPQLSETYIEAEIQCMKKWGVHIEVWRADVGISPYPTELPLHNGTLQEAIESSSPDIIHFHWISFAHPHLANLATSNIPITIRLHGFDVTRESFPSVPMHEGVKGIYAFPHQIKKLGVHDPRIKPMHVAFDTTIFSPHGGKDRKLVVRTAAALPSKDLALFCEVAKRLPDFRFVLAAVTCSQREEYVAELHAVRDAMGSPAEIRMDVPREQVAALVREAGIYLHTLRPPRAEYATPIGEPISIAEAMATGCHCFVRELPEFQDYIGESGDTYQDVDDLVEKIRATSSWSDREWEDAQRKSIDQAYAHHADLFVFRPLFDDWMAMSEKPAT